MQEQGKMFRTANAVIFSQVHDSVSTIEVIDMTDVIRADFSSVPSVSDVIVERDGKDFEVRVFMKDFDRQDLRRRVYAKEKGFYREFPEYSFDFLLLDASDNPDHVLEEPAS
jgi:hypothetical protein